MRLEPRYVFFPPFLKNYTNEYLKTYEWTRRRQAGEGREMEARDKRGLDSEMCRVSCPVCFFLLFVVTRLTMRTATISTTKTATPTGARDVMCLEPQPHVSFIYFNIHMFY
jgi:hypothetical protein